MKKILLLFLFITFLLSCSKTSTSTAGSLHNPLLLIVNASPNASQVGLFVNNGIIFSRLAFTKTYGYFQLGQGSFSMQFFRTDTAKTFLQDTIIGPNNDTTYKNTDSLLYQVLNMVTLDTAKITVQPDSSYSLFLIDSSSKMKSVLVADNLGDSSSSSPKLRFFNFSPGSPALDLSIAGNVVSSNRTFNDISSNPSLATFSSLSAGNYTLDIRLAGTSTIIATVNGVVIAPSKHYTIYAKGFFKGAGIQALGIGVIANN